MRKLVPLVFISTLTGVAASCSLFVSVDGLSGGDAASGADACGANCDGASANDGATPDGAVESGPAVDSGINPCSTGNGTAGPRMIQADGYCIDSTEVTVAQYVSFVSDGGVGVTRPPECSWKTSFAPATHGEGDPRCNGANVELDTRGNYPVSCVDWCDAWAYCDWAGKRLCGAIGGGSSAFDAVNSQWLQACASPAGNTYPSDSADGGRCVLSGPSSVVVGTSNCNGSYAGLTDMVGNVEEWVDACDSAGETDGGGGHGFDHCRDRGDEFEENFQGHGCQNADSDKRQTTSVGIGFRCCSK